MFKTGDIAFVMHTDNWISKAIAWFMKSKWSHSLGILEQGKFGTYTLETTDFEVAIGMLERYLDDPNVEMEVWRPNYEMVHEDYRNKAARKWLSLYGDLYPYLQLFSLGLRRLLRRIKIKIKNFIRIGHVCDQVVIYGVNVYPIKGIQGLDSQAYDTQEFYRKVVLSKGFDLIYKKTREQV